MRAGEQCLNLIMKWETLSLKAYKCPTGHWTIGWGHTYGVKPGQVITRGYAEALLKQDVVVAEHAVDSLVKVPLNQGMYDALVSFVFNVGADKFKSSTLLMRLNQGAYELAADEFPKWKYGTVEGKKQVLPGLVSRRAEERTMFLTAYNREKK